MLTVSYTANSNRKYLTSQSANLLSASHTHVSASYLPKVQQSLIEMFRDACSRFSDLPFMFFRNGLATTLPERPRDNACQESAQVVNAPCSPFNNLSYAKAERMVNHVTAAFRYLGIKSGDMVGLMAANSPLWLISDLAIMARGAITVPVPTTSNHEKLAYIILHSGMKLIITQKQYVSRVLGVAHRCDNLRLVLSLDTLPDSPNLINSASMVFGTLEQELLTTSVIDQMIYDEFFTSTDGSPSAHALASPLQGMRTESSPLVCREASAAVSKSEDPPTSPNSSVLSIDGISYLNEIRDSKVSTQAHLEDRLGSYYLRDGRIFTCFANGKLSACMAPFPAILNQTSTKHDRRTLEHTVDKNLVDISSYLRTHISDANSIENCLLSPEPAVLQDSEVMCSDTDTSVLNRAQAELKRLLEEETPLNIISLDVLMQKTKHIKYTSQDDVHADNTDICSILYKSNKKSCSPSSPIIGLGVTYGAFISAMISLALGYLPGHMRSPCDPYTNPFADASETPDINQAYKHQPSSPHERDKKGQSRLSTQDLAGKQNRRDSAKHLTNTFVGRGSGTRAFTADVILLGSPSIKSSGFVHHQPSFLSHLPLSMPFERVLEHVAYIRGYQIYYSSGIDRQFMIDLRDSQCTLFVGTCQIYQRIYKAGLTYLTELGNREVDRIEKDLERRADKIDNICQESMFLDQVGVDQLTSGPFGPLTVNLNIDLAAVDYIKPQTNGDDPHALAIQKVFAHSQKTLIMASRVVPERISNDDCKRILDTFSLFRNHRLTPYCKVTEKIIAKHHRLANVFLSSILKANGRLSQSLMVSLKTLFYQSQMSMLKLPSTLKFINTQAFGGNTTHFISIGGPLQHKVIEFFRVGTGGIFSTVYGVSEFLGLGCYTYYHDLPSYEGLLGRSMPGVSSVVMDCNEKCEFSLERDGVGELCFKGKMAVVGDYSGSLLFRKIVQMFKFYSNSFKTSNLGIVQILKKKFEHMGLFKVSNLTERQHNIAIALLHAIDTENSRLASNESGQLKPIKIVASSGQSPNHNNDIQESPEPNPVLATADTQAISKDTIKRPALFGLESCSFGDDTTMPSDTQLGIASIANKQGLTSFSKFSSMSVEDLRLNPPLMSQTTSSIRQSITISELKLSKLCSSACGIPLSFKDQSFTRSNQPLEKLNNNPFVTSPSEYTSHELRDQNVPFNLALKGICSPDTIISDEILELKDMPAPLDKEFNITADILPVCTDPCITDTFVDTYSKRCTSLPLFQGSFSCPQKKQCDLFKANNIFDADGYFHTGDLVKLLPDGRLVYLRSLHKHLVLGKHILDRDLANRIIESIPYIITCCLFANPNSNYTVCIINCKRYLLEARYREQKIKLKGTTSYDVVLETSKMQAYEDTLDSEGDVAIVERGLTPSVQSMSSIISNKISSRDGLLCERYGKDEDDLMRVFLPAVSPTNFTRALAQAVERFVLEDIATVIKAAGLPDIYIPKRIKIYIDREMDFNRVLYTHNGRKNYQQFDYVFKTDVRYLYSV
ncbi:Long chain fatty acid CoA ligase 5 [Giardia lamblia P15]|uniref:Long chain fatty acid CoA ligase 5 n=1 Tax=Giardia intestinalis (strain P15) TaxID=658858 RepID=E1EW89_GIAIA|nr:Long chain fatty acid CoA ligase 5 [Giardia lamblia P15]